MAVSLSKTTYSAKHKDGRTKEYTTPRNVTRYGAKDIPTGEFSIIATQDGKETVLVTAHKA
jgi:hypothetical protein